MDAASAATIEGFEGGGAPLDASLQSFFGRQLGFAFGRVRIHADAAAAAAAGALRARAFTVGRHIAFASGQYAPKSPGGQALLAHELVHVMQQEHLPQGRERVQRAPEGEPRPVPAEATSETLEAAYRRRGDTRRADAIRRCRTERRCGMVITNAQLRALYNLARSSGGDEETIRRGLAGPEFITLGFVASGPALGGAAVGTGTAAGTGVGAAGTGASAAGGGAAVGMGIVVAGVAVVALLAVLLGIGLHEEWQISQLRRALEDLGYTVLDDPLQVCIGGCHTSPAPRAPDLGRSFPPGDLFPRIPDAEQAEMLRRWIEATASPTGTTPAPDAATRTGERSEPRVDSPPRTAASCATQHPGEILCDGLPTFYTYPSEQAALRALKARTGNPSLSLRSPAVATRGPCAGRGRHYNVRSGRDYVASIVCCPCCQDSPTGPRLTNRCGIV
ncbi:eCIS core domain-containing protein [Sorangium sp. So ce131]|uniref:eCIS core domain-containing protein n=1 Tax=Sorangium sp. So ce131 TaxID=3133282 RepID=UPI003F630E4E